MSKNIHEHIRYLENRRKYESILRKKKILAEFNDPYYADSGLFAAIGDALGDITKSLKLAAMDISNELRWLGEQFLYRNDREALDNSREDFKKRQSKIYQEWEPIMKKNIAAIQSADPMLALALAPGAYMATKSIEAGISAGKTAAEIIMAEPWSDIRKRISSFDWGDEETGDPQKAQKAQDLGMGAIYDQMRKQNSLLLRLEDLFNRRATAPQNESLFREQKEYSKNDDDKKSGDKKEKEAAEKFQGIQSSPREFIEEFLSLTGIDDQLADVASSNLSGKSKLMEEAIPVIENIKAVITLIQTSSLNDFKSMIANIVSKNKIPPAATQGFAKIIPGIEENAKKMTEKPEFREEAAKSLEKTIDTITDEELYDIALSESFRVGKSKFNSDQAKGVAEFLETIEKNHVEIQIPDNPNDPVIKHAKERSDLPEAAEFVDVYNRYIEAYKELQDAKEKIRL
jgi:hypothetical protein